MNPCTDTFCIWSPLPLKNPQGVANLKKAIYVVRSDSIMGVTLYFFYCSSLSQLDDVGVGKLREMFTLHTNRHAIHGRFTPKDDCERQVSFGTTGPLRELKERIIEVYGAPNVFLLFRVVICL